MNVQNFDLQRADLQRQLEALATAESRQKETDRIDTKRAELLGQISALDGARHLVSAADQLAAEKQAAADRAVIAKRYTDAAADVERLRQGEAVAREAYINAVRERQIFESRADALALTAREHQAIGSTPDVDSTVATWRRLEGAIIDCLEFVPAALTPASRDAVRAELPGSSIGNMIAQIVGNAPKMTPDLVDQAQQAADDLLYVTRFEQLARPANAALTALRDLVVRDGAKYGLMPDTPSSTIYRIITDQIGNLPGGQVLVNQIVLSVRAQAAQQ